MEDKIFFIDINTKKHKVCLFIFVVGRMNKKLKRIDEDAKSFHQHYRERSVKNGIKSSQLKKDSVDKIYYPIKPGKYNLKQNAIF